MMTKIRMYRPQVAKESISLLEKVFESGWIGLGPVTAKFEEVLSSSEYVGKNVVAVNSGTAALHLALVVSDIPQGSTVIVPANTFISTAAIVLQNKCHVALADIDRFTGNISIESIKQILKDEENVKGMIPVHYAGIPCELDEIQNIAEDNNLIIIEDCAHALGSIWNEMPLGSSLNVQAYSFHATKMVPIGEGGCIAFPEEETAMRAKRLRRFGIDTSNRNWGVPYDIHEIGFKYNMGDIAAAIGIAQLKELDKKILHHRNLLERYYERLSNTAVELVHEYNSRDRSAGFAVPVLVGNRDIVRKRLYDFGIESEIYFRSLNNFPIPCKRFLPIADQFQKDVVCLPIHSMLSITDVDYVCDKLLESLCI